MRFRRYHVTWQDNGDVEIAKFEEKSLAKEWLAFLQTCARSDGAIRDIKFVEFNPRAPRRPFGRTETIRW
jgi:hypothetical protein